MTEIDLNVVNDQCLSRRIDNIKEVRSEVSAWQWHRNKRPRLIGSSLPMVHG